MTRLEKAWATRRAKYGPSGGNTAQNHRYASIASIPSEKRGRYYSLRKMHGADMAKEIIRLELSDASSAHS